MGDDVRTELRRLWDEHVLRAPPYAEWHDLEERFGAWDTHPEVLAVDEAGDVDLILYDEYVAGSVSSVLGTSRSGARELAGVKPDARLTLYLELCEANAPDEQTRSKVEACRSYVGHLERMLELALLVPKR